MRKTTVFAPQNVRLLDVTVVTELFGRARTADGPAYQLSICSEDEEVLVGTAPLKLRAMSRLEALTTAHTLIIMGSSTPLTPPSAAVQSAVQSAVSQGIRIVAFSTGAFTLGYAGVLDKRRVTIAESYRIEFGHLFPEARLETDPIVSDSQILTSGDFPFSARLGLQLISRDCGRDVADRVRSAFTEKAVASNRDVIAPPPQKELAGLTIWARDNLSSGLTLERLIEQSGMTSRSFHRKFQRELQMSPIQWLKRTQVEEAKRLLKDFDVPIDSIWQRTGFERPRTFQINFKIAVGLSPAAYRAHKRAG